ncbi:hypothetical protein FACS1894164_00240 [Spirochaetia bacterium]|nr:hypothetical protein FACS1894164_00240 [Spirochaetia bacterium]
MKKLLVMLLGLSLATTGVFAAGTQATQPVQVKAVFGSEPATLDPALNRDVPGAIYLSHAFEGLYKYEDSGNGVAQVVPGIALDAPSKVVNPNGEVVLTFRLKGYIKWSDGKPVTANDFVYSWQRLVDPATEAPYSAVLDAVKNAKEIRNGVDGVSKTDLGVKALDDQHLEVTLTFDAPDFFETTAFPATFPVRQDIIERAGAAWASDPATYVSNGPYYLVEWVHNDHLLFEKNPNYYGYFNKETGSYETDKLYGPKELYFYLQDDGLKTLQGFSEGEFNFIKTIPASELQKLRDVGRVRIAKVGDSSNSELPYLVDDALIGTFYNQLGYFFFKNVRLAW